MAIFLWLMLVAISAMLSYRRFVLAGREITLLPDPGRLGIIAARLGLSSKLSSATGELEGFAIEIQEGANDRHVFSIDSRGRIPAWIQIRQRRRTRDKRRSESGFETRDRFFDERFVTLAPPLGAGALLDASVRRAFLDLGRVELTGGVVRATITASRIPAIERAFRQLFDAARMLASSVPYEERLLKTGSTDQNPFVRLRALEILAGSRPHSDVTERALWVALEDPHIPIALFAAIRLGAHVARDRLKNLARLAASADDERIAAFAELLEHEPIDELIPLLLEASRSFYGKFASRALEWAVEHGGRAAILLLLKDPGATQSENLIAFMDQAEGAVRRQGPDARLDEELEQAILRILLDTRRRLFAARSAAAALLGALGSSNALPALKVIAKGDLDAPVGLTKTARGAIVQIQARKNAMSGSLALVENDSDAGDLSLSNEEGALSSPEP